MLADDLLKQKTVIEERISLEKDEEKRKDLTDRLAAVMFLMGIETLASDKCNEIIKNGDIKNFPYITVNTIEKIHYCTWQKGNIPNNKPNYTEEYTNVLRRNKYIPNMCYLLGINSKIDLDEIKKEGSDNFTEFSYEFNIPSRKLIDFNERLGRSGR